jgi:hypothetical protein
MFNIRFSVERWKWNADFGIYVSNKGRFRSCDKRDLPIQIAQNGYCWVYCGGSVHKHMLAHRVVMLTWRPTANAENLTVDHLDHNKRNNSLENLEWVTSEENSRRAKADFIVKVEGDPSLVKKVDVSIVSDQSVQTKYDFYLRLNKTVVLSVEQFADLFFKTLGRSAVCPNTKKVCRDENEFCSVIARKVSSLPAWQGKLFGFDCEIMKKGE